ncbi:GNAT family N-acetyltransferase [Paenibacillus taiwanensis]|uniref:GNAT family N-acetyltransferase n=1 Tax=Paenibacillus taiwanensis TaxID=401638 RepID=UPI00040DF453|nr:GNAT family protein [Paenibacillus taiwanensis]
MDNKPCAPYIFKLMRLEEAENIVKWNYAPAYSMYNMSDDIEEIQELLDGSYYSVKNAGDELVGFFCFGENAQVNAGASQGIYLDQTALDIGLGMRPDLTGQGKGTEFLIAGMDFTRKKFNPHKLRLSVAAFNNRAISLYKKVGFMPKSSFINEYNGNKTEFILMEN